MNEQKRWRYLLIGLGVIVLWGQWGCGGAGKRPSMDMAYSSYQDEEPVAEAAAEETYEEAVPDAWDGEFQFEDDTVTGNFAPRSHKFSSVNENEQNNQNAGYTSKQTHGNPDVKAINPNNPPDKEAALPMVVYTGFLKLRVRRLLDTIDTITEETENRGGYIESITQSVIVVRIPAGDFDKVLASFELLGTVLTRSVKATDVTEQFTDLGARLAVTREAQARLLKLLEQTEDVTERLKIVDAIKRYSEKIEAISSTLSTLQNLIDFFTITIELEPVLSNTQREYLRSPFEWIRNLAAHQTSLFDGKDEFSMKLPNEFVLFDEDEQYRAQSADTAVIRGAVVDNEPLGDNLFWSKAVDYEMTGRDEVLVETENAGPVAYRVYKSQDIKPRLYLVGVATDNEDLYVIEVFYPDEAAFEKHHANIVEMLSTFKVQ